MAELDIGQTSFAREPCFGRSATRCHAEDHNCIPIRKWFRQRWVCVRCNRIFKVDTR